MIAFGASDMTKAYVGSTEGSKAYLGDELVWGGSSPVLPYDAEVEYLGFTGTQWINTGITGNRDTTVTIDLCPTTSSTMVAFGYRSSATSKNISVIVSTVNIIVDFGNYNNTRLSAPYSANSWYTVYDSRSKREVTTVEDGTSVSDTRTYSKTFTTASTLRIGYTGSTFPSGYTYFIGLVGKCVIANSSTTVRDYIPVRVGQVGYLYDRVRGELFGNSGTGNFTLGPDVI